VKLLSSGPAVASLPEMKSLSVAEDGSAASVPSGATTTTPKATRLASTGRSVAPPSDHESSVTPSMAGLGGAMRETSKAAGSEVPMAST
jgi:hypothetical protein